MSSRLLLDEGNRREQFRLLEISESEEEEAEAVDRLLSTTTAAAVNSPTTTASSLSFNHHLNPQPSILGSNRPKKKIRLKRKQRDFNRNGGHNNPHSGGSSFYSDTDSEFYELWNWFRPSRYRKKCSLRSLFILTLILFLISGIVILAYYSSSLYNKISSIQLQLDSLMEEKKSITENHHYYHTQIQELLSNQSLVKANITLLHRQYDQFSSQLMKLNASVHSVLNNLESAPELKNLPIQVQEANKNMAKFGSHLSDLDSRVNRLETKMTPQNLNNLRNKLPSNEKAAESGSLNTTKVRSMIHEVTNPMKRDLDSVNRNRKIFATEITEQLKNQENRVAQSLDIINKLEENVRNVSAKVDVNQQKCERNEKSIQELLKRKKD